ncbi:hypothetical protein NVV30_13410, partial [Pseudomonas syringae]|nr:hypothetical protein [Pseudomonas syringae]
MTYLADLPWAPIIAGGVLKFDGVTKLNYVHLGYPDKPSSPPSLSDMSYLAGRGLAVKVSAMQNVYCENFKVGELIQLNFKG